MNILHHVFPKKLTDELILNKALDVAAGISYLHTREIIHGDLKGVSLLT